MVVDSASWTQLTNCKSTKICFKLFSIFHFQRREKKIKFLEAGWYREVDQKSLGIGWYREDKQMMSGNPVVIKICVPKLKRLIQMNKKYLTNWEDI